MKLSIIIPAYNEEHNIVHVIDEVISTLSEIKGINGFEIIVVDDHSSDSTYSIVEKLNLKNVLIARLSKRSGSHDAIRAGLSICNGDAAFCITADGQDDPKVLIDMVPLLCEDYEVVWAHRKIAPSFHLNILRLVFYFLLKILTKKTAVDLSTADYFLIGKKMIDSINRCTETNTSLYGLINWIGFNQINLSYNRRERRVGKSKWNLISRLKLASDWIVSFSGIPLRIITILGLVTAFIGLLYSLYIMILGFLKLTSPGWAETVIITLFLGGIQLTMLGVTGEYIWRNLEESRRRPQFFIEKQSKLK